MQSFFNTDQPEIIVSNITIMECIISPRRHQAIIVASNVKITKCKLPQENTSPYLLRPRKALWDATFLQPRPYKSNVGRGRKAKDRAPFLSVAEAFEA